MDPLNSFTPPDGSWDLVNDTAFIEFEVPGGFALNSGPNEHEEKAQRIYEKAKEQLQKVKGARIAFSDEEKKIRFFHHDREVKAIAAAAGIYKLIPKSPSVLSEGLAVTKGKIGADELVQTDSGYNHYLEWEKTCFEKADDFFSSHTFTEISSDQLSSGKLLAQKLLQDHEGFCIGEYHDKCEPKKYLIENMSKLKEAGVKTLYLEHLFYDSMQEVLDDTLARKDKQLPKYMENYLAIMDSGFQIPDTRYGYLELVKSALNKGIRVVGIDTTGSYLCGSHRKKGVVSSKDRYQGMNYIASLIMQHEQQKGEAGKFVALMGKFHTLTEEGVPGVAEIMHVPAVSVGGTGSRLQLKAESNSMEAIALKSGELEEESSEKENLRASIRDSNQHRKGLGKIFKRLFGKGSSGEISK